MKKKSIIGASIGNCVHVAGVIHFLDLAREEGYDTVFLGPAISPERIIEAVIEAEPEIVAVGYRLTPENAVPLVEELRRLAQRLPEQPHWLFGGTKPVADRVRELGFFNTIMDSTEDLDDVIAFLRRGSREQENQAEAHTLMERVCQKRPYPLLRHHFGLPSLQETIEGIEQIAKARVLDVISLGPDQNTQQFFFHPENRDPQMDGAGGVPIRTREDFLALKRASQCGNYPLMRCYSGTADVMRFAELLEETIQNAWCAVPLCWYNELDGRGTRTIEQSAKEAQQLMAWHGRRGIPVEMNEPHHWGLRDAHDVISVAMAYISAYNAKASGVHDYVAQYMFNIPNAMSFSMDLAKVLAMVELSETLKDEDFRMLREVRAGLPFLSGDTVLAKGQLAASTYLSMAVSPDIIHVVGYSEAEHAATPDVVIESCKIVRGVVRSILHGGVDQTCDPSVQQRKQELKDEALVLIEDIKSRFSDVSEDPLADAGVIAKCIQMGILDAPHIVKNAKFHGILKTRMIRGRCVAYDEATGRELSERERLQQVERHEQMIAGEG